MALNDYFERSRDLLIDPATSTFLKDVLRQMDRRDPVDALHDLEEAYSLARLRCDEAMKAAKHKILAPTDPAS